MGVIQNQFNSALTGLTFLAQQTPGWQYGKKVNEAKMGEQSQKKLLDEAKQEGAKVFQDKSASVVAKDTAKRTIRGYKEDYEGFVEANKLYLPEEFAEVNKNQAREKWETEKFKIRQALALKKAQESAQARQNEINTEKSNMKGFVEQIRAMNESGAISNRQAKSMIYKAEHQEDKK